MSKCLQSGACCFTFEVHGVPGYQDKIKPERQQCHHLIPAYKDFEGKWHKAKCKLYNSLDFPGECRKFNFPGTNGMCGLGQAIWKSRGVKDFNTDIK